MPVTIIVPTPMQRYTMNKDEVEVGGATVDHALHAPVGELPRHQEAPVQRRRHACGRLSMSTSMTKIAGIFRAGQPRSSDGDTLTIVPSIAGGLDAVGTGGAPSFHLAREPGSAETACPTTKCCATRAT